MRLSKAKEQDQSYFPTHKCSYTGFTAARKNAIKSLSVNAAMCVSLKELPVNKSTNALRWLSFTVFCI